MSRVAQLIADLKKPDSAARAQAAWELGNLGPASAPASDALVRALADDAARANAQWALVKIGPDAIPDLTRAQDHPAAAVRQAVMSTLWRMASAERLDLLKPFAKALGDTEPEVRRYATLGLGQIGPAAAAQLPALAETLNDPCPKVRAAGAVSLGRVGSVDPAAVSGLIRLLSDPETIPREAAAASLFQLAERSRSGTLRQALPTLDRLAGPDSRVRSPYRRLASLIRSVCRLGSNLPLPASEAAPSTDDLPLPAVTPVPPPESLPRLPSED